MGQRFVEWRIRSRGQGWRVTDFAKEEGLKPKVKKLSKNVKIGRRGKRTSVTQTITDGDQGPKLPAAG